MITLSLDISTNTGYAIFEDGELVGKGNFLVKDKKISYLEHTTESMHAMLGACENLSCYVDDAIMKYDVDEVIIEQTNRSRSRWSQKMLEWLHYSIITSILEEFYYVNINYIDTSEWRSILDIRMTNADKKHNKEVRNGKARGKLTSKHLAVRWANQMFGLELKQKDNDIADALALATAFFVKEKRIEVINGRREKKV